MLADGEDEICEYSNKINYVGNLANKSNDKPDTLQGS